MRYLSKWSIETQGEYRDEGADRRYSEDQLFHFLLRGSYCCSLFGSGNGSSEEEFYFANVFFDEGDILEIFEISAFEHFFHHCQMGVSSECFFRDVSSILCFCQGIDNFIYLLHKSLFRYFQFFEETTMQRQKKDKNQQFDNDEQNN